MSDRPKSPSPKTAPCLHGAERKNDVKNEPEDNSEPVHEAVNDASLAQDAQDPQVSSSMNDENIPQNAAPVHQEGVLQLESPWFVISVWTEIFRSSFSQSQIIFVRTTTFFSSILILKTLFVLIIERKIVSFRIHSN